MNILIQKGNITRELDLRYTPKGTPVLEIGLAVNRVWFTEGGEKKEEVTFTDWRAWGKQAENMAKFFHKGSPILLSGRLAQEEWVDKETQKKRRKTLAIVDSFEFCGGQRTASEPPGGHASTRSREQAPAPAESYQEGMEEDDIPF